MTTSMPDLIARLEAAAEGSRDLDTLIADAVCERAQVYMGRDVDTEEPHYRLGYSHRGGKHSHAPFFTTSVDAALTLIPDEAVWSLGLTQAGYSASIHLIRDQRDVIGGSDYGAALALCIAAMKARA